MSSTGRKIICAQKGCAAEGVKRFTLTGEEWAGGFNVAGWLCEPHAAHTLRPLGRWDMLLDRDRIEIVREMG